MQGLAALRTRSLQSASCWFLNDLQPTLGRVLHGNTPVGRPLKYSPGMNTCLSLQRTGPEAGVGWQTVQPSWTREG